MVLSVNMQHATEKVDFQAQRHSRHRGNSRVGRVQQTGDGRYLGTARVSCDRIDTDALHLFRHPEEGSRPGTGAALPT